MKGGGGEEEPLVAGECSIVEDTCGWRAVVTKDSVAHSKLTWANAECCSDSIASPLVALACLTPAGFF